MIGLVYTDLLYFCYFVYLLMQAMFLFWKLEFNFLPFFSCRAGADVFTRFWYRLTDLLRKQAYN